MRKEKYLGEVIAVTNQKGGCGKTTVTMNLGVALSKIGYKVLCVDIDKQVNLTSGLIKNTDKFAKADIGVILQNVLDDKKQKIQKFIVHTRYVDIIPGNRSLYKYKSLFDKREDRNTVYHNNLDI